MKEFDLNLVAIFEAVYEERNQSRAAERLGISQPAVSHALTRLRTSLNDQLFHDRAMNPTATAHDLYSQFHLGLNQIRAGFLEVEQFKPVTSHRHFSIAVTYSGGAVNGPEIFKRVRTEAPNVRLSLRSIDPVSQLPDLLRQKAIDLAISHVQGPDAALCYERLVDRVPVLIARKGHPRLSKAISFDELWSLDFVAVYGELMGFELPEHEFIRQLRQERVMFEVATAMQLLSTLVKTDLVCLTIKNMAQFAMNHFDVEMFELPVEVKPVPAYLVWHKNMDWDAANQWLRGHVRGVWAEG